MTAHIDQLTEWWESAERITKTNLPGDGDFIIYPHRGGIGYIIERSEGGWTSEVVLPDEDCRILSRAPKPKPAWHDAAAVMASTVDAADGSRWAFAAGPGDLWYDADGGYRADELIDPVPLIEAKVTDEMVERLEGHFLDTANMALPEGLARRMLHAALGLETE